MNKTQLIDEIAKSADISKSTAGAALSSFIEVVTQALQDKDTINLVGFGSFSVKNRSSRQGRNPRTGESITIKASIQPVFKAGKLLKESCNV